MHLFDPATHFSCSGIIAEGLPPALGQAFAFRQRGTRNIAVAATGEGAANQGAFHESLNLAALWQLPVVFVVEDNDWAISVPRDASTALKSNADRAQGYGMPGVRVEGNDVEAVRAATAEAVALARSGGGPSLIEIHTLRLWGHFEGDAQGYRSDASTASEHDPIPQYGNRLVETGVITDDDFSVMTASAQERVEDAVAFAKNSPHPDPAEATRYVFVEGA